MLAGGQQVGRGGADARGAERRVGQRGEVRVVAAELRVDGLRRARVQGRLQRARLVLDVQPRARVGVDVPPRGRPVRHVTGDGRVEAGLVPRLVRVCHPNTRVQGLGRRRRVDLGDEGRLSTLLRRDAARRVGKQAAVISGEGGRGGRAGGQTEGAAAAPLMCRCRGAARRHREPGETGGGGSHVAAGGRPFPRMKSSLGESAGVWQRGEGTGVADLVAGGRQHR